MARDRSWVLAPTQDSMWLLFASVLYRHVSHAGQSCFAVGLQQEQGCSDGRGPESWHWGISCLWRGRVKEFIIRGT